MYFLSIIYNLISIDINEVSFDNLWIMITMTSVYIVILLPFLSMIREKEMIESKDLYNK